MSAIACIYRLDGEPVQAGHDELVIDALKLYPADQCSVWQHEHVMLGCLLQQMTTQSLEEQLPYHDSRRGLAITADCILDNREELMDQLLIPQELRSPMPDSQLLLWAYEKWEGRMPERLVGDFAFIIWDPRQHVLFGARDFSGARTLYYHRDRQQLSLCTMIKPLLSLPHIHKSLNHTWLAEFLAIRGVFEPPDMLSTVYEGVAQLPPSHTLTVRGNDITIQKYDSLRNISPLQLSSSQEYDEAFRGVFQKAVTSRFQRSHRKVGGYLSGGLDSGSVASFAAKALQQQQRPLHTFSYVPAEDFEDWTPKRRLANERPLIEQTVQFAGNMEPSYLSFQGASPFTEIDEWLDTLESPYKFFDNTFWFRGIHEAASQQGIGVLLSGARGNYSISWGPAFGYYATLLKQLQWGKLRREVQQYSLNTGTRRKIMYSVLCRKAFPIVNRLKPVGTAYEFPQMINDAYAKETGIYHRLQDQAFIGIGSEAELPADPLEARKVHFERIHMWGTTGTSSSKLSLRYSLCGHDPTNDLRVIRFCLAAPIEQFVQQGMDRALIRRSTKGLLPDSIRLNQRTRGIQAADSLHRMKPHWQEFLNALEQMRQDSRMQHVMNMPAVDTALAEARQGIASDQAYQPAFKLLMRSLILHRFLQHHM
ncbi:asparagine synthase-related protein [Paenibacillus sp. JSM ZJ436]|uniref:asparagine synthase-related protein n=1 Tax=Paenibacillus sp. JSM ZJ436 TaxID=3376190 RepID=UPI0037B50510